MIAERRSGASRGAVCIGGACIDRKYTALSAIRPGTSNPSASGRSFGGVARNVCENLARLGVRASLLSVVGCDDEGQALLRHADACGIDTDLTMRAREVRTSEYAAVLDSGGELFLGMADMSAVETLSVRDVERRWDAVTAAGWLFVDCNVSAGVLVYCTERARASGVRLAIDAVSETKVRKLPVDLNGIHLLVLNEGESAALLGGDAAPRDAADRAAAIRMRGAEHIILTRGARGAIAAGAQIVELQAPRVRCVDATGAGDALVAGALYGLMTGADLTRAARLGIGCAALTVESAESVRTDLHPQLLEAIWTNA